MKRHGWQGPSERGRTVRVGESSWELPVAGPQGATHHLLFIVNVLAGDSWWAVEVSCLTRGTSTSVRGAHLSADGWRC